MVAGQSLPSLCKERHSDGILITSIASSTIMLSAASSAGGSDDDVECRTCYGLVVSCVSLLLFCVVKACAVTGFTVVFFGIVGWLVPGSAATATGGDAMGAARRRATHRDAGASRVVMALRRAGYSCPLGGAAAIDVPPAFCVRVSRRRREQRQVWGLCAVCLEDVQRCETLRRLPVCGHLFHKECIDMWLHSHTTCPLCRCDLSPRWHTTKTIVTTVAAYSAADALPLV